MIERSDWFGLYGERWGSEIVKESTGHPAKFSRALIRNIYAHAVGEGWVEAGDWVVDPFGGVALGAWDAMRTGLNYIGVEVEQRFVDLGNGNIEKWNDRYADHMPNWGSATLIKGDSRNLANILNQEQASSSPVLVASSPPFLASSGGSKISPSGVLADEALVKRHAAGNAALHAYGDNPANLGNMRSTGFQAAISSPPYGDISQQGGTKGLREHGTGLTGNGISFGEYGETDGQLGRMKPTTQGMDLAVSSPPYSEARIGQSSGQEQCGHHDAYGGSEGQLGTMKAANFRAAISSPPFENVTADRPSRTLIESGIQLGASSMGDGYGKADGQLGNDSGSDFWIAARQIVDQVYSVLAPGGHAIWVVKKYVKNKRRVNFDRQWAKVCVAAGFQVIHWHRAWVVEEVSAQYDLMGDLHRKTIQRKSFFRQMLEAKGSPEINWETVVCMVKPE